MTDSHRDESCPTVLVGSIGHESNTFAAYQTQLDDFAPRFGAASLSPPFHQTAYEGIVQTLQHAGVALVPTVDAHALPGGRVTRSTYERLAQTVLEKATPALDGICLFLHGAMRAEGIDSCESELLTRLRTEIGPDVPISIALDMHGNVTQSMAASANAIVAFHTAPHIDEYETGARAAELLLSMIGNQIQPTIGFAKVPLLLPGEKAQTTCGMMAEMMRMVAEVEDHPDVLSASLLNGHCWADIPDLGVAAVVVTNSNKTHAKAEADRLADAVWSSRDRFSFGSEAYPVNEAIDIAMHALDSTVFLCDSGDNPGAGGTTDVPVVLRQLLAQNAQRALVAAMWDADAVSQCNTAGTGSSVELNIGGKIDRANGQPLAVSGRVKARWPHDHSTNGDYPASHSDLALVAIQGIDVLLSSERISIEAPEHLISLGIQPLNYRVVVLKRGYLTASLEAISPRSIMMLSPGATCCDLTQLDYHNQGQSV